MTDVIARILEIEKQSALDIERAEEACRKKVESHRLAVEEERKREQALFAARENARLAEALRALGGQIEKESEAARKDQERLFRDPATLDAVGERIAAILLGDEG